MDVEKTIEFLLSNQAAHDERLIRLEIATGSIANSVGSLANSVGSLANGVEALANGVEALANGVEALAKKTTRIDEALASLSESTKLIAREAAERDRILDARIAALVSAVGAIIPRPPLTA